ncbi:alginate export family protein [Sphingomonas nostoxanthinifaciens]|uniref:alginate export family protein n=1 Tax=Sphingomonas nostoxanthinifaciens TaxID=2872652 RepID=UPI001CC1D9FB|nr:alginate export family protein [Sphingomonas nostoxanthinifaciens]UAK25228.1 alginate export family protein [Sphingomonas nostoxanthinifaciens]
MKSLALLAAALVSGAATAQDLAVTPLLNARLRYEEVSQNALPDIAHALTLRVRPGVQLSEGGWSALVEGEATAAIDTGYNDGTNGKTHYALIADPRNAELNRAQIRYAAPGFSVTAGRQLIELTDQRFVGSSSFRQNQQTFDAVRAQIGTSRGLSADLAFAWSDRTVNGIHGTGARQQAVSGDNVFALASYGAAIGTLTGFAYLVDQDEAAVQGYRLSSQTYGIRFAGNRKAGKLRLGYAASWANQSDYHRNPNRYSADYWLLEGSVALSAASAKLGYEVLGADKGIALTSVQTPLASLFPFQGWADKLTTTPPNGIRDVYATLGYGWKTLGWADAFDLQATYHRFDSDRLSQHYGNEWDLLGTIKRRRTSVSVRYARYVADAFATDTSKFWLSVEWAM